MPRGAGWGGGVCQNPHKLGGGGKVLGKRGKCRAEVAGANKLILLRFFAERCCTRTVKRSDGEGC